MSDGLQTIQIMLADAAAWRGRMEDRMDETITTLHTVAASVERYAMQSTASNALMEARLDAITKGNEHVEERLSALEGARPGGKKPVAVAASVGGGVGFLSALASSGAIDFFVAVGKRIFP
jgi:hypothetical protein